MNRRKLMLAGISVGALPTALAAGAPNAPIKFTIEAPEDVQVDQIAPDGPIQKGAQLFHLKSINVERMALQLTMFKDHLDIVERPFNDGRVDNEIATLKQKADLLKEIMIMSQKAVAV